MEHSVDKILAGTETVEDMTPPSPPLSAGEEHKANMLGAVGDAPSSEDGNDFLGSIVADETVRTHLEGKKRMVKEQRVAAAIQHNEQVLRRISEADMPAGARQSLMAQVMGATDEGNLVEDAAIDAALDRATAMAGSDLEAYTNLLDADRARGQARVTAAWQDVLGKAKANYDAQGFGGKAIDFLGGFLSIANKPQLSQIVERATGRDSGVDLFTGTDALNDFRDVYMGMPMDEQEELIYDMYKYANEEMGIFQDNQQEALDVLQSLHAVIYEDRHKVEQGETLDGLMTGFDVITGYVVGGGASLTGKGVAKAGAIRAARKEAKAVEAAKVAAAEEARVAREALQGGLDQLEEFSLLSQEASGAMPIRAAEVSTTRITASDVAQGRLDLDSGYTTVSAPYGTFSEAAEQGVGRATREQAEEVAAAQVDAGIKESQFELQAMVDDAQAQVDKKIKDKDFWVKSQTNSMQVADLDDKQVQELAKYLAREDIAKKKKAADRYDPVTQPNRKAAATKAWTNAKKSISRQAAKYVEAIKKGDIQLNRRQRSEFYGQLASDLYDESVESLKAELNQMIVDAGRKIDSAKKSRTRNIRKLADNYEGEGVPLPKPSFSISNASSVMWGTPAERLMTYGGVGSRDVLERAIVDEEVARKLGVTRIDVASETMLPRYDGESIPKVPTLTDFSARQVMDDVNEKLAKDYLEDTGEAIKPELLMSTATDLAGQLMGMGRAKNLLTAAEIDLLEEKAELLYHRMKRNPSVRDNLTTMSKAEDGSITVRSALGPKDGEYFTNSQDALDQAMKVANRHQDISLLRYSPAEGEFLPIDFADASGAPGQYLAQVTQVFRADGSAVQEGYGVFLNGAGWMTNHLDTTTRYAKEIADTTSGLQIVEARVREKLNEVLRPVADLQNNNKPAFKKMWDILQKEEADEALLTPTEVRQKLGEFGPEAVEAYKAVRQFYDTVYEIRNTRIRDMFKQRGYGTTKINYQNKSGHLKTSDEIFARPMNGNEVPADGTKVINAKTGEVVEVTQAMRASGTFYESMQQVGRRNDKHKLFYTPEGHDLSLGPIPNRVVRKVDGYLGRDMNAKYYVEDATGTVRGFSTRSKDALAFAENNPGYKVRLARENREFSESSVEQAQSLADLGLLGHTKERLNANRLREMDLSAEAAINSPVETLAKVRNQISRNVSLDDVIDTMVKRWEAEYGADFGVNGKMPWNGKVVAAGNIELSGGKTRARLAEAKAFQQKIKLISGMDEDIVGKALADRALAISEWASYGAMRNSKRKVRAWAYDTLANNAGRIAEWEGGVPSVLKKRANDILIAMNPIKQRVMQGWSAFQYIGLDGGPTYMFRAIQDFSVISMMRTQELLAKGDVDKVLAKWSKETGQEPSRAVQLYKEITESGILDSANAHQYLEGSVGSGGLRGSRFDAAKPVSSAWDSVVSTVGKHGFEAGERTNLQSAWLFSRNRMATRKGSFDLTKEELEQVTVDAIQIAGNMGRRNKAAFQAGAAGLLFQFMSHTVRHTQLILPHSKWIGYAGSPVLSGAEKGKLALYSSLVYGLPGIGITNSILNRMTDEAGIELNDDLRELMLDGLLIYGLQETIGALLADPDFDVDFEQFAPGSGMLGGVASDAGEAMNPLILTAHLMADVATGSPVDLGDYLGVSHGLIGRTGTAMMEAAKSFSNPTFDTPEKVLGAVDSMARIFPLWNNPRKAQAAATIGMWTNKNGDAITEAKYLDTVMLGVFGIQPTDKQEAYDVINSVSVDSLLQDADKTFNGIEQTGKGLAKDILSSHLQLKGDLPDDETFDRFLSDGVAVLRAAYDDDVEFQLAKEAFYSQLNDAYAKQRTGETKLGKVQERIANSISLQANFGIERTRRIMDMQKQKLPEGYEQMLDPFIAAIDNDTAYFEQMTEEQLAAQQRSERASEAFQMPEDISIGGKEEVPSEELTEADVIIPEEDTAQVAEKPLATTRAKARKQLLDEIPDDASVDQVISSPYFLNSIKLDEGSKKEGDKHVVYKDSLGKETVGYGHLVKEGEDFSEGLTEGQAEQLLAEDVRSHATEADSRLSQIAPWMDAKAKAAFYNMSFQLGTGMFDWPNLQKSLKDGDRNAILRNLADSKWAKEQTPTRAKLSIEYLADLWDIDVTFDELMKEV